MSTTPWIDVPLGLDAHNWVTRQDCRKVLAVVHTVTSGQRLTDVVPLLESDMRVQVIFTSAPDVFGNGVADFLRDLGAVVIPWEQATREKFDLAIAAAYESLHELHAPVIVLPHGAGYNKVASRRDGGVAVAAAGAYGLEPQRLVHDGRLVAAAVVLPHEAELARLAGSCPQALPAATVAGDPCYDRLMASLHRRRDYRDALGVAGHRKLLVVTSTWGPRSLLGRHPDLLPRLMDEVCGSEYRVVALFHPNVWFAHGPWQVRTWLAGCRRQGLTLVPPLADWRGALVAADCVLGDHGSVSLYGAATGVPVLLTDTAGSEVDPSSGMGALAATAPRLDTGSAVLPQVRLAASGYRPTRHESAVGRVTSEPGRFAANMRHLMYRLMDLDQPTGTPRAQPVDAPTPSPDHPRTG